MVPMMSEHQEAAINCHRMEIALDDPIEETVAKVANMYELHVDNEQKQICNFQLTKSYNYINEEAFTACQSNGPSVCLSF